MKAIHDADKSLAKIDLRDNYDQEVADGCTEDSSFNMIATIAGIRYFNFRSHQSKKTIAEYIYFGMQVSLDPKIWKIAFRLRDQNTKKEGAAKEYGRHKNYAYNKSNDRVIKEN